MEGNIFRLSYLQFLLILLVEQQLITDQKQEKLNKKDILSRTSCLAHLNQFFDNKQNNIQFKPLIDKFIDIIVECDTYKGFIDFLSFITHVPKENIQLKMMVSRMGIVVVSLNIGDAKFNGNEFEELRQIILKQNGIDFDYVKEYDPDLETKMGILRKGNNWEYANFEEQAFTLSLIMGKNPIELSDYTLYQFNKMIARHSLLIDYSAYKPLESAGFIKLKDGQIPHYLSHIKKKGRYDDLYIDKDEFTNKVLKPLAKEGGG